MSISAKNLLPPLLDCVFSFPCPACRERLPERRGTFCNECLAGLDFVSPPFCPGCGGSHDGVLKVCAKCLKADTRPWSQAISVFNMTPAVSELVQKFKYNNNPEMARPFGVLAANILKRSGLTPDFLVPTPLHWTRAWRRGFNQSSLLCEIISEELGVPVLYILKRTRRTRQQTRLNREERKKNLAGAFCVRGQTSIENRSILLLDDVMTTGATLSAAANALLAGGAREINVLALARR
ncbi:MAG: hypothetical protein A2X49_12940 [Lentisphaerae bacterium GWF2_52_8]|nr:MAG: hypothetical protein A2X49_12940 [Lentisphaerae bacterium GWF2_52_8]